MALFTMTCPCCVLVVVVMFDMIYCLDRLSAVEFLNNVKWMLTLGIYGYYERMQSDIH